MFRPRTGQVSREDFVDDDVAISVAASQAVRAETLRLIPTTGAPTPTDLGWPVVPWTQEDELYSFPGEIDALWDSIFNNLTVTTPQLFDFEPASNFLDIHTVSGEYQYLRQKTGGTAGKKVWADGVNNAIGWTLQARVQVLVDQEGTAGAGHCLVVDDGAHREVFWITATGLWAEHNRDLSIRSDFTKPRELRIGAKQDDLYLLLDDGQGVVGIDAFTGTTVAKELGFGAPTPRDAEYRTLFDYMNQWHGGLRVDEHSGVSQVYSMVGSTATTAAFSPKKRVRRFEMVFVETSGDLVNGTTTVTIQRKSSVTTTWTTFVTTPISLIGKQGIDVAAMPVAGDGTDELRFLVNQVSATGEAEAPRVEAISVLTTFSEPGIEIHPNWGHRGGGSLHAVDLLPTAADVMGIPSTATGLDLLASFWNDFIDQVVPVTGTPSGYSDFLGNEWGTGGARLGQLVADTTTLTTAFQTFTERVPYGKLFSVATPIYTAGAFLLSEATVSEGSTLYTAQRAASSQAGNGFSVVVPAGIDVLSFLLDVQKGSVTVTHGAMVHVFRSSEYFGGKRVRIRLGTPGDPILFVAAEEAIFRIADFHGYDRSAGSVAFTGFAHATANFAADVFLDPEEIADDTVFSTISGNNGWEVGLSPGGYPYAEAGDGAQLDAVTSAWPVPVDERHNLALSYRDFGTYKSLEILIDGEVAGRKVTTLSQVTAGGNLVVGGIAGLYEQMRVHAGAIDAHVFSALNGFSSPVFESAYSVPRSAENVLILRFTEKSGAFSDDSGLGNHPITESPLGLLRSYVFEDRVATLFWLTGKLRVLHTPEQVIPLPVSLFVRGIFYASDTVQEIYSKWNLAETVGWKVEILTDGTVKVTVKDGGSTYTVTSDVAISDEYRRSIYAKVSATGISLSVDGTTKTTAFSIGTLATATQNATIGASLRAVLAELVVCHGTITAYDDWRDGAKVKWTPTSDKVLVDGVEVDNARIIHYSHSRKYVRMPAGGPGNVAFHVLADGVYLDVGDPFFYTYGYSRDVDPELIAQVAKTHSPFRILPGVPDGSVNLAFIQTPDLAVERNVSSIDLSHLAPENISNYLGGEFALRDPEVGTGVVSFRGQVDTDDLRVSNRAVVRRDVKDPTSLFYRYLIGRGRRYVYQPNALTVADLKIIRDGISLIDGNGQAISFDFFPWEIEVSTTDIDGETLPANTFAVTLFSAYPYIDDISIQVRYTAKDKADRFTTVQPNFVEFVNTEPMMAKVSASPGPEEFLAEITPTGLYDIVVGLNP